MKLLSPVLPILLFTAVTLSIDAETLRGYALDYFHVDKGVKFYQKVYEQLSFSRKTYEPVSNTNTF